MPFVTGEYYESSTNTEGELCFDLYSTLLHPLSEFKNIGGGMHTYLAQN